MPPKSKSSSTAPVASKVEPDPEPEPPAFTEFPSIKSMSTIHDETIDPPTESEPPGESDDARDVAVQLEQLSAMLASALERRVGGNAPVEHLPKRVNGVSLPPLRTRIDQVVDSVTPLQRMNSMFSKNTKRERMIQKSIQEARRLISEGDNVSATPILNPEEVQIHERRLGDAKAALQTAHLHGELQNTLRAKEVELANLMAEHDAVERGYKAALEKNAIVRRLQEAMMELSEKHRIWMFDKQSQQKNLTARLLALEKEAKDNHRVIEDLSTQIQSFQQKAPKGEVEALARIHEANTALAAIAADLSRLESDSEMAIESRRRQLEDVNLTIANFDPKEFVTKSIDEASSKLRLTNSDGGGGGKKFAEDGKPLSTPLSNEEPPPHTADDQQGKPSEAQDPPQVPNDRFRPTSDRLKRIKEKERGSKKVHEENLLKFLGHSPPEVS